MADKRKIRVAIIAGGKSAEHEVALQSAKNVIAAIDKNKYEVSLIGVDKQGKWHLEDSNFLLNSTSPKLIQLNASNQNVTLTPQSNGQILNITNNSNNQAIDVVFPILHGPFGEDGTMQGLLKLANVPFVGAGVLGSAVGMDKDVMKRLLRDAGIPVAKFITVTNQTKPTFKEVVDKLGLPIFVKPANLGSSVGVSKVKNEKEFKEALKQAFDFDRKALIEEYIKGREIECSVLGNEEPMASIPGEIVVNQDFYSYDAKYIDEEGATLKIPADLPEETIKNVQEMAIKAFQVLCCEGMARVDCFLTEDRKLYVNEINTIPGFTKISMYPKLWEASGISYTELIDRLIQLAIERFEKEKKLKTSAF